MLRLLFPILSYGAFLLLLMPTTGAGMVGALVLLALGGTIMARRRVRLTAFVKTPYRFLICVSIFAAAYAGTGFYDRWLPSSRVQAIAAMLHMSVEPFLVIVSVLLAAAAIGFIHIVLRAGLRRISHFGRPLSFAGGLCVCAIAAIVTVIAAQLMIRIDVFSMGLLNFLWNAWIVWAVILLLYGLLGRTTPAIAFGAGIFMLISTVNVYVYSFRERLFEPVDIFSIGTAMNVADSYSLFPIPRSLLIGWGIFLSCVYILNCLPCHSKPGLTAKKRLAVLLICALSLTATFLYADQLKTAHWHKQGAEINGYVLDFVSKLKEISASEPQNYSADRIGEVAASYSVGDNTSETEPARLPHIIVIMDEAFSDLSILGDFTTDQPVMPFLSSLKENTISGYALTSVYGGNTANSEYEFLTGNSLAWLSPNVVPYQQYIRSSTYSMVSYLKSSYHYKCVAMHPYHASGWNRPAAYAYLGFDECCFEEAFPQTDYIRNYISDQEMFEFLIKTYEAQKEEPLFLFGVTMQNHGGYSYTGERYTGSVSLDDPVGEFSDVEQYLSLVHETDKAVEYLISYFQKVDEDVIVVFFGDHQPKLNASFYEAISKNTADTLNERQKRYQVPFFIWANYEIEEKAIDCVSLNYLSSYVYQVAGISLPPYNRFLREMETVIPSINANGFYSLRDGCYLPFDEADEAQQHWLELYEMLQYNSIFDKAHLNKTLFPILE